MADPGTVPQDVLREEILSEARRQAEALLLRAGEESSSVVARAREEAEREKARILDKARAEISRRTGVILASVAVEAARMRSARIEALLESVRADVGAMIGGVGTPGFPATELRMAEYRDVAAGLAAEALRAMDGRTFEVRVRAGDRVAFGEEWLAEVRRRAGRPDVDLRFSDEPLTGDAGVIVRDADGRQVWDNRLTARLERLWPELRRMVAARAGLMGPAVPPGGGA